MNWSRALLGGAIIVAGVVGGISTTLALNHNSVRVPVPSQSGCDPVQVAKLEGLLTGQMATTYGTQPEYRTDELEILRVACHLPPSPNSPPLFN